MSLPHKTAISINGGVYEIACAPEEERRVRSLARRVDERVGELAQAVGQIGDANLFLLAALTLEDERDAASTHAEQVLSEIEALRDCAPLKPEAEAARDQRLAKALLNAAQRIQCLADKLDAA